ncbi:MAG: sugar phosphate isomerase/epimerase [Clostridia bacterium]|nr:sugar phosphate isomerase/epimerase [Clostridia bacterium]
MNKIIFDQFSVMSVQYIQYSFDFFLHSMKLCGIKNIDLWGGSPHYSRLHYTNGQEAEKKVKELRKKIDDCDLRVVVYTPETLTYPFSYSSPEATVRARTIEYMMAAMEDALLLGTKNLFLNTGCGLRDLPREESWKRCVESIQILCEKANVMGIDMIIEQLQPYESNLLVSQEDMFTMLQQVNSPSLNVCVDVVAMEVMGENLETQYSLFGDKIKLFHYCDGNPSGHSILGEGDLPLKKYIEIMEKQKFDGYLSLEINDSMYWLDPHASIRKSVDYIHDKLHI